MKKKITKRERIRRKRLKMIRSLITNILGGIVVAIAMFVFMDGFLDSWVDEMDAQAKYNREYYMNTHMYKDEVLEQIKNADQ